MSPSPTSGVPEAPLDGQIYGRQSAHWTPVVSAVGPPGPEGPEGPAGPAGPAGGGSTEGWVNVKDYGALGDGSHDDTTAIQAAINFAFGSPSGHILNAKANKTLYFPPGDYKILSVLTITGVQGIQMVGAGRMTTRIQNLIAGAGVFLVNGMGYFAIQGITFEGTGSTGVLFDLNWDNVVPASTQAGSFFDCAFETGGTGLRMGYLGFQVSEIVLLQCHFTNLVTGLSVWNFNAVQMVILGGQCQSCSNYGIYISAGAVPTINGMGFQNGNANIADIAIINQAGDCYSITGCRSESKNFAIVYAGTKGQIVGCSQQNATAGRFLETNDYTSLDVVGCDSQNGQIFLSSHEQMAIRECKFGRNDWISASGAFDVANIEIENVIYNNSATPAFIRKQRMTGILARSSVPVFNYMVSGTPLSYTIAAGVITPVTPIGRWIKVDTEASAATDDLDTITVTNFILGDEIVVSSANSARDTTLKDGTGNLRLASDFILTSTDDRIVLQYDGTNWCELHRSDNA